MKFRLTVIYKITNFINDSRHCIKLILDND